MNIFDNCVILEPWNKGCYAGRNHGEPRGTKQQTYIAFGSEEFKRYQELDEGCGHRWSEKIYWRQPTSSTMVSDAYNLRNSIYTENKIKKKR